MASYRLSVEAEHDLDQIWVFGVVRFGEEQADAYLDQLHATMLSIASNPRIGKKVPQAKHYLRVNCKAHAIFFERSDDGPLIVRVLRQSMDFARHL